MAADKIEKKSINFTKIVFLYFRQNIQLCIQGGCEDQAGGGGCVHQGDVRQAAGALQVCDGAPLLQAAPGHRPAGPVSGHSVTMSSC